MRQRHRFGEPNMMPRGFQWTAYAILALVLTGMLVAGCTPAPVVVTPDEWAAIYATVIRRIYTTDDTFGGTLAPDTLFIIRATDDAAADPLAERSESVTLSEQVQADITAALDDLPTRIEWVDSRDDVPLDPETNGVAGDGAIITLGTIHPQEDGAVHVAGSIYVAMLAAGGQTYVMEQVDGVWTITGTTGPIWMS